MQLKTGGFLAEGRVSNPKTEFANGLQKAGLKAGIARLDRLPAAHIDDKHAVRRQIRDAERDIEYSTRRLGEVGKDIERLVPTTGDGFSMVVGAIRSPSANSPVAR